MSMQWGEPPPVNDDTLPTVFELVVGDLQSRLAFGIAKYGVPLKPHNGRDPLKDAYEEAIDLVLYLRQALYERDNRKGQP